MKNKTTQKMSEMMFKTREELLAEPRENLSLHEQSRSRDIKEKPRYDLGRSDRVVRDDSVVKIISLSNKEESS